jgi:uncharacterized repeat protein (TIGR01451 family)
VGLNPPGESTVTFNEVPFASIHMTKAADRQSFSAADETIQYTYDVTNTGSEPLTNVRIDDNLPGLSAIVCDETDLAPQQSTICRATYVTTQADVNAGFIANAATATGTDPDGNDVTDDDNLTIPAARSPMLALRKTADEPSFSAAGQTITYRYHVVNTGNTTLENVTVSDNRIGQYAIPCTPSTLAPNEEADCTATYTTTQADVDAGYIYNVAIARGTPPGAMEPIGSNPDDHTIPAESRPSISVEKSADRSSFSAAGQDIRYTYRVTNTGNVTLENVGVADDLPGLSEVTCEATTLAPDESTTCSATYRTTPEDVERGVIHNSAVSHGTPPGETEPVESDPSDVTIRAAEQPAITVRKSASPTTYSASGQLIRYTYRVTNTGSVRLENVGVTDDLPGLSEVTCEATALDPGESTTCTATYRTTQEDVRRGSIHNSARSHGTPPGETEPVVSEPSDVTIHAKAKPSLKIRKSVRPKTFGHVGQVLHYTYRVTNTGSVTLHDVGVEDGLRGLSAIRCPQRTLAPGESMTCTATYRVRAKDVKCKTVRNRAVAFGRPPGSRKPVWSRPSSAVAYGHVPVTG